MQRMCARPQQNGGQPGERFQGFCALLAGRVRPQSDSALHRQPTVIWWDLTQLLVRK